MYGEEEDVEVISVWQVRKSSIRAYEQVYEIEPWREKSEKNVCVRIIECVSDRKGERKRERQKDSVRACVCVREKGRRRSMKEKGHYMENNQ